MICSETAGRSTERGFHSALLSSDSPRIRRKSSAIWLRDSRHVGRLACLFARRRNGHPTRHDVLRGAALYSALGSFRRTSRTPGGRDPAGTRDSAKGLVPLVLIAPLLWIAGRRWPDLLILAGATIAVAAPWYVLCYLRNGDIFIDEFFWKHHFSRFAIARFQHVQPWWFYIPVLIGLTVSLVAVLALFRTRRKIIAENFCF